MIKHKIIWTELARENVKDIYSYIALDSVNRAKSVIQKILCTVTNLEEYPLIGSIESNLALIKKDYRFIVSGNYKIIYKLSENSIYIMTVFDSRRDPILITKIIK
jgi:plasmid stabilization system protein ParE